MQKIVKGTAFDEYVTKRCEEIVETDKEHQEIESQIVMLEKKLHGIVSVEAASILNEIADLKEKQTVTDYCKIYISGYNDRIRYV